MTIFLLVLALATLIPSAAFAATPHSGNNDTQTCNACHVPHTAATQRYIFRDRGTPAGEQTMCFYCHDGSGALGNVKTGPDSFSGTTGHKLEGITDEATPQDLTNACSGCHQPHGDPLVRPKLPGGSVNGVEVAEAGNDWCLACHNDTNDWYSLIGTYPPLAAPSRDTTNYPVAGTFAGSTVYENATTNAHVNIPASTEPTRTVGDCLYCHNAHGSTNAYDGLSATFRPSTTATVAADRANGTYAALCFTCHAGGTWESMGAPNIKQFVTFGAGDTGPMDTGGHRIKTAGGTLPVNAPLPCYDCHNPHGSSRGNKRLLSDELGGSLDTSAGPAAVRSFCLTCHVTSDLYSWDTTTSAYVSVSSTATVEGLLRNGGTFGTGPDGGYNWLRLKVTSGHAAADTGMSCYLCHGSDYTGAGSSNVHAPGSYSASLHTATVPSATITILGQSYPTQVCADCHNMELGPEHQKGTSSSATEDCEACHPTARESLGNWANDGCTGGACHTVSSTVPMHAEADADHTPPSVSCTAAGCHSAAGGLAVMHSAATTTVAGETLTSCAVCHAAGVPTTKDCATCHGSGAHPPHTVSGPCISSNCHVSGDAMTIHGQPGGPGCDACHADGITPTFACRACHTNPHPNSAMVNHGPASDQCYSCHASSSIMAMHGDNCDRCHPVPAGPSAVYSGGCSQAGCHPGIHVGDHQNADHGEGSDCGSCHSINPYECGWCHSPSNERAKPVTTTNAVAAYTAVAGITLTAVDQGDAYFTSGIKATYFQLDGQELQTGNFVVVPGPTSGTQTHTLEYWSIDNHWNIETHHIIYFTITAGPPDTTPPSGTMTLSNGAAYSNGSATVNSDVTGCDAGMRIDPGTGVYGPWIPYAASTSITLPAGDGTKTVNVQYRDGSNNLLTLTDTIVADRNAPNVSISINAGASYTNNTAVTLNMTMSDAYSGLNQMQFSTNATNWTAWEPWSLSKAYTILSGSGTKWAYVRVSDNAGNMRAIGDSIYLDTVLPTGTMTINANAQYTLSTSVTLNLAFADVNSGLSQVRFSNDAGVTWSAWENYAASKPWTLTEGDGSKTVLVQCSDNAGNVYQTSDVIILGGVTDYDPPTGSIAINGGAMYTNGSAVTLDLYAVDEMGGSGLWDMHFSNDAGVTWSAWEPYATTKAWTMATTGSPRTVYVQYRDAAGNISTTYSDSILIDNVRPTGTVTINAGAFYTDNQTVTLTVTGTDGMGGSGVTHMQFSNDSGATWSAWQAFAGSTSWTLSAGASHKTVYVQVRDAAGNVSYSAGDTIAYQVKHTLTYTAGANGTVSGASPQLVNYGSSGTAVTAVPASGYHFLGWSDGSIANPRTEAFAAGNVDVTAWFGADGTYTVRFYSDGNGSLSGQWIQAVPPGGSTTPVTANEDNGYPFSYWGGPAIIGGHTLVRTNVTANESWTAYYDTSGSCPFLYTWDGSGFRFEADEFAAGYLGLRTSKGYRRPNPIDYHVLATEPAPKDGALEYKLVEERYETDYLDQVILYTVDAPADRDVYVERSQAEGVGTFTTLNKVIHTTEKNLAPPPSVIRLDTGEEVRDALAASDGDYVILNENRNFAYTYQTIELDLGAVQNAPQTKLVIDGRTMIPTSAEGRAYSRTYGPQVKFEVQDAAGKWVSVPTTNTILPKPPEFTRPFVLDLSKIWISSSRKVRLTYLYKTYIDSILLDTSADVPVTLTEVPLVSASLEPHGFNFKAGIGELYEYVYGAAFAEPSYKLPGNYTRFGDVAPLLGDVDDKFVVFGGGDEITLRFAVPELAPAGTTREYLFFSNGYYKTLKEDIAHTVEPLPFAAMSTFPYPISEAYPIDPEHMLYRSIYNTRYESD